MSRHRIFSADQIAVMGDDELRRQISRGREANRRAEEANDVNAAIDIQFDLCYFLRERELRQLRQEAHQRYLQLQVSQGFSPIEA